MPLVEKRYAQAFFDLAENDIDNVRMEFEDFVGIYNSDEEFRSFLVDPRVKLDNKQMVVRNVFTSSLSRNMLNFVLLLISKQRIKFVPQIYEAFIHLVNEKANVLVMDIITAVKLEEEQLNSIKEKFRSKYNASSVKATEIVDVSIIGGVKVIIGDKVYDGSIKGKLESLTELVSI